VVSDERAIWRGGRVDPLDPSFDELRAWAASGELAPMQDWDLMISDESNGEDLQRLVEERLQGRFFLGCLYILAGDAVRTGFRNTDENRLGQLIDRAHRSSDPWLVKWAERTQELIAHPEKFDYSAWCGGALASDPIGA
jgi:hypothetical protein